MGFIIAAAKIVAAVVAKSAVLKFVAGTVLSIGVSRLMAKRAMKKANAGGDGGARIQLPPATDNKLPIVYGSAFTSGPVTDAKISTDQKTMWYVVALAEHSDDQGAGGGSYTFDTTNIYYDGKKVNFVGGTAQVASLAVNNQGTTQIDTKVNGKLFIYLFTNGSNSGVNTGGQTAIQILQDSQIPAGQRWTANHVMTNTCFAIVKVIYNTDAGTTNLGALACKITNSLTKPGECLKDYMLNTRYGAAIPLARIDTDSLDDLDTYSDQTITYIPADGDTTPPLPTQARYRINGPLDTANDCLTNLQILVDACDSWLQYSELSGKWKVVINKPYDTAPNAETLNDLFLVDSSNLVGGITINPVDLNETFNEVEVAYPNKNIKDQTDFQVIELEDYQAGLLSPNEAINRLNVQLPVVNEAVQAKYLAVRRLLQSREDLIIIFRTDYSGIQVLAGDIIRVTHPVYGWTEKLFRVSNVAEEKYSDGTLGAQLVAFEYNGTIYADNAIQDFVPAFNTGLTDPNIISQPGDPTVVINPQEDGQNKTFRVTSAVPEQGTILYMDFNYGNSANTEEHVLYRMVQAAGAIPFTNSPDIANANVTNVSVDFSDLPRGNYYFSCTARNDFAGRTSNSTAVFTWDGPGITIPNVDITTNSVSNGTIIDHDGLNVCIGGNVFVTGGDGRFFPGTYITQINSNTQFVVNQAPDVPLSNANISVSCGGVSGNNIQGNTIQYDNLAPSAGGLQQIAKLDFKIGDFGANVVTTPIDLSTTTGANWVNINVPFYLDGTNPGANYIYPYYQGTSTTANGYDANSTSSFNPANAASLTFFQGDDNWYVYTLATFDPEVLPFPQEFKEINSYTQFVSNVDAQVQIFSGIVAQVSGNLAAQGDTQTIGTYDLKANRPLWITYTARTVTIGGNSSAGGMFIRNITANSRVTCVSSQYEVYKGKIE